MLDYCSVYVLALTLILVISPSGCQHANGNNSTEGLNDPNGIEKPVFPPKSDLRIDPVYNTILYLKGTDLLPKEQDKILIDQAPEDIAISFIDYYKTQFKLDHPREELRCIAIDTDTLGFVHVRFQQVFNGFDVWGKEINVHLDQNHRVNLVQGRYVPTPHHLGTTAAISPVMAVEKALCALDIKLQTREPDRAQLIIFPKSPEDGIRLAYKVEIPSWLVFVDAISGDIVERIPLRQTSRKVFEPTMR